MKILSISISVFLTPGLHAIDVSHVAVASNMTQVLTDLKAGYLQSTKANIELVFGSSGNIARQIVQGAPFDIFLSANRTFVDFLIDKQVPIAVETKFAAGSIAYFIPNDSQLSGINNLKEVNAALRNGNFTRLAIASPEIAPYGIAAQQALQAAGLWVINQSKLIQGENVAQTMQFSLSGGVDVGIVPYSYSQISQHQGKGRFMLIPETSHQPIIQYLVLIQDASTGSRAFYDYLLSDKATQTLETYHYHRIDGDN